MIKTRNSRGSDVQKMLRGGIVGLEKGTMPKDPHVFISELKEECCPPTFDIASKVVKMACRG
jgi:hypothetical protein